MATQKKDELSKRSTKEGEGKTSNMSTTAKVNTDETIGTTETARAAEAAGTAGAAGTTETARTAESAGTAGATGTTETARADEAAGTAGAAGTTESARAAESAGTAGATGTTETARPAEAAGSSELPAKDLSEANEDLEAKDVVTFEKVTKIFNTPDGGFFTAIENVTFTIPDIPDKGEFIAVLGPSGCGKSTVLNIIAGLEPSFPPSSGRALVRGEEITGPGPDRGMVFQSYSSFPCYTVLENVALGLKLQGIGRIEREEKAMEWIKKVKLSGSEFKYPHQLSGGMRQRVAIARSLVLHPRIILMDEPFGALDRITRWEMQDLLVGLWQEVEATVFLVTHDIAEAVYLGDRIFLFSNSPAKLLEIIKVPPPSGKAAETQRTDEFSSLVNEISCKVEKPLSEEK